MASHPATPIPPDRNQAWTWILIVSIWVLLFLMVLSVGAAVIFWRQAATAKLALASTTAQRDALAVQLSATDAQLATVTQDRTTLVNQLATTTTQLANANNQLTLNNANLGKLTSDRDRLTDQLATANASLAKLTTERDTLAQQLAAAQSKLLAAAPAPQPPIAPAQSPLAPHKRGGKQPADPNPAPAPVPVAPAPAPPGIPLATRLDADITALLPNDPQRSAIIEAAQLFETTDRAAHWTNYLRALEILREHRSRAALPLLLKYALKCNSFNAASPHVFSDAITILTGEEIFLGDDRGRDASQLETAVQKFYEEWFLKNKNSFTVDPNKMTDDQHRRVVAILLGSAQDASRFEHSSSGVAYEANQYLTYTLTKYPKDSQGRRPRGGFFESDLCPAMTPLLLEAAGWSKNPQANPPQIPPAFPVDIIPMLAFLRKDGGAPDLNKIAADPTQSNVTRLICLLALHAAGESIPADHLLAIASDEKKLETRVYAISALQYTPAKNVPDKIVDFLADPNEEIAAAACCALEKNPTTDALPALKKIIEADALKSAMRPAFAALSKIKTAASAEVLANFLSNQLKTNSVEHYFYDAFSAFCTLTGYRQKPGAHSPEEMTQEVTAALTWWNANKNNPKR